MNPRPSYSTAYVAKRLGVSLPTVQRWVDAGRLKAWKTVGGHRRVDAESADLLFYQQEQGILPPSEELPVKVVIVDDNPDDRDLMSAIVEIKAPGAQITLAENGYEGLLKIGDIKPDLVITDIVMPKMDGFEMVAQLLTHAGAKTPGVMVMSSLTPEQLSQRGSLPPNVRLLSKPLVLEEVGALLDAVLQGLAKTAA